MPRELMLTKCFPALDGKNDAFISHGRPRQSRMSKVLDPSELLIPIEP